MVLELEHILSDFELAELADKITELDVNILNAKRTIISLQQDLAKLKADNASMERDRFKLSEEYQAGKRTEEIAVTIRNTADGYREYVNYEGIVVKKEPLNAGENLGLFNEETESDPFSAFTEEEIESIMEDDSNVEETEFELLSGNQAPKGLLMSADYQD